MRRRMKRSEEKERRSTRRKDEQMSGEKMKRIRYVCSDMLCEKSAGLEESRV
jgi:hypothetical protein